MTENNDGIKRSRVGDILIITGIVLVCAIFVVALVEMNVI